MQTTLREKRRGGGAVAGMLAIVLVFVAVLAIAFAVRGTDFFLHKLFAPREEAARRETFEQSKSYRDGLAQELWDMRVQYAGADEAHKDALASIFLQKIATVPPDQVPEGLRQFARELEARATGGGR